MVAILWDRSSSHYDLLIPEGDDFDSNRSRQLQSILSRCSLEYQPLKQLPQETLGLSQSEKNLVNQRSQDQEEVNYGGSSLE